MGGGQAQARRAHARVDVELGRQEGGRTRRTILKETSLDPKA
jgi:hypothetical protein